MEAAYISRNVDHFISPNLSSTPYHISNKVAADVSLTSLLYTSLEDTMSVKMGVNLSADSFYASQGRYTTSFNDENSDLIEKVKERYSDALTIEMESFYVSAGVLMCS
jgi:uridine phosphorylase